MNQNLPQNSSPLIEFCDVRKIYGRFAANDGLSFKINCGEIHAIIGENGAGKTTAMKLLFGEEALTSGNILFKGVKRPWSNPRGALTHGVGMVHQHFMLSPAHTALENVVLGREFSFHDSGALGWVRSFFSRLIPMNLRATQAALDELAREIDFKIPWNDLVAKLPVGVQQQLEIMKLLYSGADVMIFDEPTAVLSPIERDKFLELLIRLREMGRTIILITHKLQEVKQVADVITVLRRGKFVASHQSQELSVQSMADLMVGRAVALGDLPRSENTSGSEKLVITGLTSINRQNRTILKDIDVSIRAGEIIGIAGVDGSGQKELWDYVCGPVEYGENHNAQVGRFEVLGDSAINCTRAEIRRKSIGVIPPDRLRDAIISENDLIENDLLGHDYEFRSVATPLGFWLDRKKAARRLQSVIKVYDVRPAELLGNINNLSGGNQQKFVICREFSRSPSLIFCAEPTRGVDVGSVELIHREILRHRDQGAGILLISSQLEELMALSDHIHVMFDGAVISRFVRGQFSEKAIGRAMGGFGL